jgi:cyanophycinase-like exopeptidase
MAQRGLSGSGQELAAQLQSSQAASQLASQQGLQQAAQAQRARVDALSNLSNMATGIDSTDFQRQAQKSQAQDVIKQFNTQKRTVAGLRNLQTQQDLANMNVQERNRIAQANADLANQQIMQNQVNRPLAQYGLQTQYTSALGQGIGGVGQTQTQQQLANQQAMSQGLGTGLTVGGTVAGAALTGKK